MSLLNIRGKKDELPRAGNMPPPPAGQQPTTRSYDPAALEFAQRIVNDQAEITRLKADGDQWRARALAAEEQIKRLEDTLERMGKDHDHQMQTLVDGHDREIAKREDQRHRETERLTEDRDFYKLKFARTVERLQVAGKIILDSLTADTGEREIKPPPKVDMAAIAAEIEQAAPPPAPAAKADPFVAGSDGDGPGVLRSEQDLWKPRGEQTPTS
jgi:hypothetical protein